MSSKEKNVEKVEPAPKKESLSVLETIRRRTGLLVGIVGLALVIFILESLLGSTTTLFGSDETSAGNINGHKIDRNEFARMVEMAVNNYKQRSQGQEGDESMRAQAIESSWQQMVRQYAIVPQIEKAGISVGDDELYMHVVANPDQNIIQNLTDPQTGKINAQFSTPDGGLDLMKWKQAVQGVTGESELAVSQMEEGVTSTRLFVKFRLMVNKGIYVTTAEARELYKAQNTRMEVTYVAKRFDAIKDSTIKLTDDELQKYYKDHSYRYINKDNMRSIEYVAYNVTPSDKDMEAISADAKRAAEQFKGKTPAQDSVFIAQESENGSIIIQNYTKKTMIVRDSSIYTAPVGSVFGPINEGAYFKIYKLEAINSVADSARVRHILVGTGDPNQPKRTKERAKKEADSVLVLLKDKKAIFDSLVVNYSDDGGSKKNGGDYGWFDENEQFVEPFKNAGLLGTKGQISVVETQFGYHIIEVLDVSKSRHTSYQVAQIFKPIAPSDETRQAIFAQANQFAGENNTGELFDKAVETQKLTKRLAGDVKEGDRQLPGGLDRTKDLVKWMYASNVGDINTFTFSDKFIVAKLSKIKNAGVLPYDIVKEDVTQQLLNQKKGELMIAEFTAKAGNSTNVDEIASKLGLESKKQENMIQDAHNVEGLGHDDILIGTANGLKAGSVSKAIMGENGVFIVGVTKVIAPPDAKDYNNQKSQIAKEITARTDYDAFNAIKDAADIEDHKFKVD